MNDDQPKETTLASCRHRPSLVDPTRQQGTLGDFVAELTEAAYPVALRHKERKKWLDLELDLWKVLAQTVERWEQRVTLPLSK